MFLPPAASSKGMVTRNVPSTVFNLIKQEQNKIFVVFFSCVQPTSMPMYHHLALKNILQTGFFFIKQFHENNAAK